MSTDTFMVVSPHTEKECLVGLDSLASKGDKALKQWEFGCLSGDHTAYGTISASSESEALGAVPESVRPRAHAVKVTQFTTQQVKALHQAH